MNKLTILQKEKYFFTIRNDITEKTYLVKYHGVLNFTVIFHLVNKELYGGFDDLKFIGYMHTTNDIFRKDVIDWVEETILKEK